MNLKVQVKILDLFAKIVNGNLNKVAYIDYAPQKADFQKIESNKMFPRTTPEEQGISSKYLLDFLKEIENEESIHLQGIMITRHNSVILEAAYKPYDLSTWRITHSLAKSVIGIAIGIAQDEGFLSVEDSVASIFHKKTGIRSIPIIANRRKELTIRDLLEMASGVNYNEVASLVDGNWTEGYLEALNSGEPGKEFYYNSMNTYMLSAIIQETTGQNVMEFLKKRLFEPLGIENIHWELSPEQKVKGGWGLYITMEDRTKLGQLFLNQGQWEGKQIVSEQWIKEMTQRRRSTPRNQGQYGYGYQVWMGKRKDSFLFNGLFGQNTIVFPDLDMVITTLASNKNLFVKCKLLDIIEKYFATNAFRPGEKLQANKKWTSELHNYVSQLCYQKEFHPTVPRARIRNKRGWQSFMARRRSGYGELLKDLPEEANKIPTEVFKAEENDVGIMPLTIQTMQNSFSKGLTKFWFKKKEGSLVLYIEEHDQVFEIPIGFSKPRYSTQTFFKEHYQISAWGVMKSTEDDVPVLKLQLAFLEMTNCRTMKFYFYDDHADICYDEIPEVQGVISEVLVTLNFSLPANGIETLKNMDRIQEKLKSMSTPRVTAHIMQ